MIKLARSHALKIVFERPDLKHRRNGAILRIFSFVAYVVITKLITILISLSILYNALIGLHASVFASGGFSLFAISLIKVVYHSLYIS